MESGSPGQAEEAARRKSVNTTHSSMVSASVPVLPSSAMGCGREL